MHAERELAQHLILHLRDRRVIAPTMAARRCLAAAVFRICGDALIVFSGVDTHLHLELACAAAAARQVARRLEISLHRRLRLDIGFGHHCEPVRDQAHLQRAFFYILRQRERHDYHDDPYHDASSLPDLLGLRLQGRQTAVRVRALLPRVGRAELLEVYGVADLARPVELSATLLPEAAAAAAGLPDLGDNSPATVAARRAVVTAAAGQLRQAELARLLGVDPRPVRRLAAGPADAGLVLALCLQARLRATIGRPEKRLLADLAGGATQSRLTL